MRALLSVLLFSTACGKGFNPEENFLGLWKYTAGTREGLSCYEHMLDSTCPSGKHA